MKRTLASLAVVLGLLTIGCAVALAFPKPSPFPKAWELKFQHSVAKRIVVELPDPKNDSAKIPQAFWYVTFTVTNETDQEQSFLPRFEMLAVDGSIVRSDRAVHPAVFDAIKAREKLQFLEPLAKVTGRILPGAAQARDSVAIWPEVDRKMGKFSIFAQGLSGEATFYKVENGEYKEVEKVDPKDDKLLLLRKTLQMDFDAPGLADEAKLVDEQWIMR